MLLQGRAAEKVRVTLWAGFERPDVEQSALGLAKVMAQHSRGAQGYSGPRQRDTKAADEVPAREQLLPQRLLQPLLLLVDLLPRRVCPAGSLDPVPFFAAFLASLSQGACARALARMKNAYPLICFSQVAACARS